MAASWTQNTYKNNLGYTLLQLVAGKYCTLPALTEENEAKESSSEAEAVQKIMERSLKIQEQFRKAHIRTKLTDCQGTQVQGYHHQDKYIEDVKFWYQPHDSSTWIGPAEVGHHWEYKDLYM